jgi:hypothetical protein
MLPSPVGAQKPASKKEQTGPPELVLSPAPELCYRREPALSVGWTPAPGIAGRLDIDVRTRRPLVRTFPNIGAAWEQIGPPAVSIRGVNY